MSKPILLLDIDGVLNVFPEKGSTLELERSIRDGYVVDMRPDIGDMIAVLKERFEIKFFTLWNHLAAEWFGETLGLESADFVYTDFETGYDTAMGIGLNYGQISAMMYAKTPILENALDAGTPFVWIDDDIGQADRLYLEYRGWPSKSFSLLRVDPTKGMDWDTVRDAVSAFDSVSDVAQ